MARKYLKRHSVRSKYNGTTGTCFVKVGVWNTLGGVHGLTSKMARFTCWWRFAKVSEPMPFSGTILLQLRMYFVPLQRQIMYSLCLSILRHPRGHKTLHIKPCWPNDHVSPSLQPVRPTPLAEVTVTTLFVTKPSRVGHTCRRMNVYLSPNINLW